MMRSKLQGSELLGSPDGTGAWTGTEGPPFGPVISAVE